MPKETELYIVVCTEFHYSVGPFSTMKIALETCDKLNEMSECVYLPVLFDAAAGVQVVDTEPKRQEIYTRGGYL